LIDTACIRFKLAIEISDSSFCPSHPRRELVFFNQTFGEADEITRGGQRT
jgi:hypothetical protein